MEKDQSAVTKIECRGQQFEMEQRNCCNCGKEFRALVTSMQTICSSLCGPGGVMVKRGWERNNKEMLERLRRQQKARKDALLTQAAVVVERKLALTAENAKKVVHENPTALHIVEDPVDQITPSAEELVHQRWLSHVERARKIVKSMTHSRMEIAHLAIGACDIRRGGGTHWKGWDGVYTLKQFGLEIGVHPKTLHNWVKVCRDVRPAIPDDVWDDNDWGAAWRTSNRIQRGDPPKKVLKEYKRQLGREGIRIQFHSVIKKLSYARHFLKTAGMEKMDEEDLKLARELCSEIILLIDTSKS